MANLRPACRSWHSSRGASFGNRLRARTVIQQSPVSRAPLVTTWDRHGQRQALRDPALTPCVSQTD